MSDFSSYQSPFSWRYGSELMRVIWSEYNKRLLWRRLWVELADAECDLRLVSKDQVEDLRQNASNIDITKSLEIEATIKHDLMAEVKVFASQCTIGGGIIHTGATSMDIKDNAEVLQIQQSVDLLLEEIKELLLTFVDFIEKNAAVPVMAFTHLQPAEPTTLGYRFSSYAQDLCDDYEALFSFRQKIRGKGFKGAVGNAASFIELIGKENFFKLEASIAQRLDLQFYPVATQTYSRRQDFILLSHLSSLASSLSKFAFDLRVLQSQPIGELSEPFGKNQVGSSAMPFKRNPIDAEKIDSLARIVAAAPQIAWQNASNSLLERTLDDSANRRTILPESFLAVDEMISTTTKILRGLVINEQVIQKNMATYGPFAAVERLMMALVKKGADRQKMHETLRLHSLDAWNQITKGNSNPLIENVAHDESLNQYLTPDEIVNMMETKGYTGIAEERSLDLTKRILYSLKQ